MHRQSAAVLWWLLATSTVACSGIVAHPFAFDDDEDPSSVPDFDGGRGPSRTTDAAVARDGGIVPGDEDAAPEASLPCGDGVLGSGETCDDGNRTSADGCNAT